MKIPPYFKQEGPATCSLAVLRMVLGEYGFHTIEEELVNKVTPEYEHHFSNIWNTTIARIACEYDLNTTLSAEWPLLKKGALTSALSAWESNPAFSIHRYENPEDTDTLPEPLTLAYAELFKAVKQGCKTMYGGLTDTAIRELLTQGYLIQTSVKRERLYPQTSPAFHSILLYHTDGDIVSFHDPYRGPEQKCRAEHMVQSTMDTGAFMYYAHT